MSSSTPKPLVIIGGGGHSSVLVDILREQKREILAVISPEKIVQRQIFSSYRHLHRDDDVNQFSADEVLLVNGIGQLPNSNFKRKLNEQFLMLGYEFETVISNNAMISPYACISPGVQVLSGAIIQAGVKLGKHSVINSGVVVEHDCCIGEYNHIAPRATICGQVKTGADVFIGAASVVIQNLLLERNSLVGAGAIVTKSLQEGQVCYSAQSFIG